MNDLAFETIFAFFAFATTRYTLPKMLTDKKFIFQEMLMMSFFYALCALLRKWGRENLNKKSKTCLG